MKKTVLLIEDDRIVRENTSEILQLANYEVETADNGKTGIEIAKKIIPDIIICDVLMPVLDGYGVLQIISKNKDLEHIPFIFLTAKTLHEDLRKGMELGADDYISKPFEESELLRAIDSRLKRVEAFEQKLNINSIPDHIQKHDLNSIQNINQFLAKKRVHFFQKNESIYCKGNSSNHLFLIKEGLVKTYKINELGKELNTDFYTNGQYFGFASFVKHGSHFDNAKAITNTQLYKINKDEINAIINNNHHIIYNFMDLLAEKLMKSNERLLVQAYGSVRKKTAETLLNLLENYPIKTANELFISRLNLSNTIGIPKETLARTLHDFKEEKLIEVSKKAIKILDKNKLLKIN
jgi:DNA-binding response OmpR family regulator